MTRCLLDCAVRHLDSWGTSATLPEAPALRHRRYTLVMLTLVVALWLLPTDLTVHAGGTDVAVRCMGTRAVSQPLVLLEAGGGDDLNVWSQPRRSTWFLARPL